MTFRERNTVAEVYFINAIEIPWTNNDGNWIYDVNRMETWNVMKFINIHYTLFRYVSGYIELRTAIDGITNNVLNDNVSSLLYTTLFIEWSSLTSTNTVCLK